MNNRFTPVSCSCVKSWNAVSRPLGASCPIGGGILPQAWGKMSPFWSLAKRALHVRASQNANEWCILLKVNPRVCHPQKSQHHGIKSFYTERSFSLREGLAPRYSMAPCPVFPLSSLAAWIPLLCVWSFHELSHLLYFYQTLKTFWHLLRLWSFPNFVTLLLHM